MSESALGAGFALDEDFDFSVNSAGDLDGESGVSELEKDLAMQMAIELQQFLGKPPGGNLEARVAGTVRDVAISDVRVDSVLRGSISVDIDAANEKITVKLEVVADTGETYDMVIQV